MAPLFAIIRFVAFSIALALLPQALPAPTPQPATPDEVDAYVQAEMARQHIPGLSLAVVRSGEIVKAKGYGFADVEHRQPVAPETIWGG